MSTEPDYIIEVHRASRECKVDGEGVPSQTAPTEPRAWIGVRFECCGVYQRIYRSPGATEYAGRCPKCAKIVRVRVGPGGTQDRFFSAI